MLDSRTFESAVALLRSRARLARPQTHIDVDLPARQMPSTPSLTGRPALHGMREWLERLGHSRSELDKMNIIHVAGTKGKGSTCAFIESFLRAHGRAHSFPRRTGLYTSPHLLQLNERIRINFEPLTQARFTKYVYEVCDSLSLNQGGDGPRYLQLLALVSFHAFLCEGVDVAIYETHHGGEYDATNVIEHPTVTAITSIGMDHVIDLGPSIQNIAWHKAGILKTGAAAFCVPQEPAVSQVLQNRAATAHVSLNIVAMDPDLPGEFPSDVQRLNCSLARAVSDEFLLRKAPEGQPQRLSSQAIIDGIRQFSWPGRFQIIRDDSITWFLDGAHNELSISEAARWFGAASSQRSIDSSLSRILIFGQISTSRDIEKVVQRLAESIDVQIDRIIFTTHHEHKDDCSIEEVASLQRYSAIWKDSEVQRTTRCVAVGLREALDSVYDVAMQRDVHVLVTGSLRLVGAALNLGLSRHSGVDPVPGAIQS